jgi:GT2 family glycosyltransferase
VKSFPLAILLVFRNQKEIAEKTLTNIYSNLNPDFELYVVDDASEDETRQTIQSVIEYYAHESTYFFENSTSQGREECLQELIQQVKTPFLWMPEDIDEAFDQFLKVQQLLKSSLSDLNKSDQNSVNETDVSGDKLRPDSLAAVWLVSGEEIQKTEESPSRGEKIDGYKVDKKPEMTEPDRPKKMPVKLKSMYKMHSLVLPENASDAAREIFPKMDEYVQEGEYLYALKLVDAEQINHPLDSDLIRLKIKVLELMRRYVEAAELKHQLKLGGPGVARPKIRRESIIIVDPTEDYEGTAVVDQQGKKEVKGSEVNKVKTKEYVPLESTKVVDVQQDVDFDDFDSGVIGVPRPMSVPKEESTPDAFEEDKAEDAQIDDVPLLDDKPDISSEFVQQDDQEYDDVTEYQLRLDSNSGTNQELESELEKNAVLDEDSSAIDESDSVEEMDQDRVIESGEMEAPTEESLAESENTEDQESIDEVNSQVDQPAFMQPVNPVHKSLTKPVFDGKYNGTPKISIIIPTTIDGKGLLERTVYSLGKYGDGADRELIIIDNASLDDTYDYLKQLKKENFMQVRIVTNHENLGFARSINQGIEIARGQYIMVLHNDTVMHTDIPGKLVEIMEAHDEITVLGPTTQVTMCDAQRTKIPDTDERKVKNTRFIDSFCMMLRKKNVGKFDEQYGLAYFEDMDYCLQDVKNGGSIAVAVGLSVDHLGGATTSAIGMESFSRAYWKNASLFESKWNLLPPLPEYSNDENPIKKLVAISNVINPYYPETHLLTAIINLMTSEVRNEIIETKHSQKQLSSLIRLMMIIDMRDVLRTLEERLIINEYDPHLIYQLIDFYYQKNIYSRCQKYLAKINPNYKSFGFGLLELRVLMGTKDISKAVELLSRLINEVPTHPELFKITADIHRIQGNKTEADEFYSLAYQTDPYTNRKV